MPDGSYLSAQYVDSNTLTVAEDYTEKFPTWTRVQVVFSDASKAQAHVISQSYSSPNTTVKLSKDILDNTLTHVAPGIVSSGNVRSLPVHSHDDDESNEGHGGPIPYTVRRGIFTYVDGDTVTIGPFRYYCQKATATLPWHKQVFWNNTELTFNFTSLGADQNQYVYIDWSVAELKKNGKIDATCLRNSTTAPTWSDERYGWYDGDDLCIWGFPTNSLAEIESFAMRGDYMLLYRSGWDIAANTLLPTTFSDWNVNMPIIFPSILCHFLSDSGNVTIEQSNPDGTDAHNTRIYQNFNSTWVLSETNIALAGNQTFRIKNTGDENKMIYIKTYAYRIGEGI